MIDPDAKKYKYIMKPCSECGDDAYMSIKDDCPQCGNMNVTVVRNPDYFELELGTKYILRNGLETSPLRRASSDTNYIYEADVMEEGYDTPSILYWLKSGRSLLNGERREMPNDIIKSYVRP